jgi:two-component system, OmpR family, response regulator
MSILSGPVFWVWPSVGRLSEGDLKIASGRAHLQQMPRNGPNTGSMATDPARVLVVEDEAVLREAIASALGMAGFVVATLASGTDFEREVSAFRPDAAILDVTLPGGPARSGLALAGVLRASTQAVVLFVTARDSVPDRLAGFDAGADDYVIKPFAMPELVARLRAVLRRAGRLVSTTMQVADLLVDEDVGQVQRGRREIAVTATELRLLAYLARNRGRVLSKTQILTQVWGYDDYDPNLVETYVSSLRRKTEGVDGELGDRLIHTVRGIGYRMDATSALAS